MVGAVEGTLSLYSLAGTIPSHFRNSGITTQERLYWSITNLYHQLHAICAAKALTYVQYLPLTRLLLALPAPQTKKLRDLFFRHPIDSSSDRDIGLLELDTAAVLIWPRCLQSNSITPSSKYDTPFRVILDPILSRSERGRSLITRVTL